ncbi:MAG: DUF4238 domain-containing protein [Solirubrobacterales bacterium]
MSDPKLHHYVPQFYLRRFCDAAGRLWAWDREADRTFIASPGSVAAERSFYYLDVLAEQGHDPLTMERQLASIEHETACITSQWIEWVGGWRRSTPACLPSASQQTWWIARTLRRSLWHRGSSFRVVTTLQGRGILPQQSVLMSTLLIGSRASGLHRRAISTYRVPVSSGSLD